VESEKLSWIEFVPINGMVPTERLFLENTWSPQFRKIFARTHGIVFTGGMDIPPQIYQKETSLLSEPTTPIRSYYECSFLFHLIGGGQNNHFKPFLQSRPSYPILAICLGCQTMNVAAGGTLIQDIPTTLYGITTIEQLLRQDQNQIHSARYQKQIHPLEENLAPSFHQIRLLDHSLFMVEFGMKPTDHPYVLTSHHQAVDQLGQNLIVTATSMDGKVIEGIRHRLFPNVIGVQFHPEHRDLYKKGVFFKRSPLEGADFNPRSFLMAHQPSMTFHRRIWSWFSKALKIQSDSLKSLR
jgi:putative glutamine amidotransferase